MPETRGLEKRDVFRRAVVPDATKSTSNLAKSDESDVRTSYPCSDSGDCDGATHDMSMPVGSVQVMSTEVGLFGTPRKVSAAGVEAGDIPTW